jgi:hypothetical protein
MDHWAHAVNRAHQEVIDVQEQWRAAEQVKLP